MKENVKSLSFVYIKDLTNYERPRMRVLSINGDPLTRSQRTGIVLGNAYYFREDAIYYDMDTLIIEKIDSLIAELEKLQRQYKNKYERPPYLEDGI